jgi:hypothetical protein
MNSPVSSKENLLAMLQKLLMIFFFSRNIYF